MPGPDDFPQSLLDHIRKRAAEQGRSVQEEIDAILAHYGNRPPSPPDDDSDPPEDSTSQESSPNAN